MRTATNPTTGERVMFSGGQWVPYSDESVIETAAPSIPRRTATNPQTGERVYLDEKLNQWIPIEKPGPLKSFGKGLGALAKTAARVPENLVAKTIMAVQGQSGASVADRGIADRFVNWVDKRNLELSGEYDNAGDFIPGAISNKDVAELGPNLAFSGVSMGGTLGGGLAAAPIPIPGARIAGGFAGGAVAAHRMDSYQVMNDWLERVNQESIDKGLGPISKKAEDKFKTEMSKLATEHGLWEAGPEGFGNVLEMALMTAKNIPGLRWVPKGVLGKAVKGAARLGGTLLAEGGTETVTQVGQHNVEVEAGMSNEPKRKWTSGDDILKSAKEVLPQVLLLTGVMGAGGAVYRKARGDGKEVTRSTEGLGAPVTPQVTPQAAPPPPVQASGLGQPVQPEAVQPQQAPIAEQPVGRQGLGVYQPAEDEIERNRLARESYGPVAPPTALQPIQVEAETKGPPPVPTYLKDAIELSKKQPIQPVSEPIIEAPIPEVAPVEKAPEIADQEATAKAKEPQIDLTKIDESALVAFPDMMESEGGLLPLGRFTPNEQQSLRNSGIVETAKTSSGETYEGVNAEYLWERRKQVQSEKKKGTPPPVSTEAAEPSEKAAPAKAGKKLSESKFADVLIAADLMRESDRGKKQYAYKYRDAIPNNKWLSQKEIFSRIWQPGDDAAAFFGRDVTKWVDIVGLLERRYRKDGTPIYAWAGTEAEAGSISDKEADELWVKKSATPEPPKVTEPAKPDAQAVPESKKTEEPAYTAEQLKSVQVEIKAIREDTGRIYKIKERADKALADIDEQLETYYALRECVS